MPEGPIPSVVAMLVCEQIITEQGSNAKTLINIFENMRAASFPFIVNRIGIYAKLVDAQGNYQFTFRLVNLKDETLVAQMQAAMNIMDSAYCAELTLNLQNFPILPEAGKYEFQLYAGDVYLSRVTLNVIQVQGGTPWQPPRPHR
jgi:hypothetical protein